MATTATVGVVIAGILQAVTPPAALAAPATSAPVSEEGVTEPASTEPPLEVEADGSIPALTTETSTSIALPDGSIQATVSPVAINYLDDTGSWAPIDTRLTGAPDGDGLVSTAGPVQIALPDSTTDPLSVTRQVSGEQDQSIGLQLDAPGVPIVATPDDVAAVLNLDEVQAASTAVAVDVLPETSIAWSATGNGVKESIVLASAEASRSFTHRLQVTDGLTPRIQDDGSISVTDEDNELVFNIPAPFADDAARAHTEAVSYILAPGGPNLWQLTTTVDDEWLDAADRVFPVIVDPSVVWVSPNGNISPNRACMISPAITTSQCTTQFPSNLLRIGATSSAPYRSLFMFGDLGAIPAGSEITQAYLTLSVVGAGQTNVNGNFNVDAFSVTQPWTAATWTATGTGTNWTAPGGDRSAFRVGRTAVDFAAAAAKPNGYPVKLDVTGAMIASATGRNANTGFMIANSGLEQTKGEVRFATLASTRTCDDETPAACGASYLTINYRPAAGLTGAKTQYTQEITDTADASINVASGSLLTQARDLAFSSAGPASALTRYYDPTPMDNVAEEAIHGIDGWTFNIPHIEGAHQSSPAYSVERVAYTDETGSLYTFMTIEDRQFTDAPGIAATARKNANGTYTIYRYDERITELFNADGTLTSQTDDNGNARTFAWATNPTRLTGITDASGRTITINYTGTGTSTRVASVADSAGRTVTYSYTGDLLTQVTGADGKVTKYSYDNSRRLSRITAPSGRETTIAYDSANRVTSLTRITNPLSGGGAGNSGFTTSFAYSSNPAAGGGIPNGQTILTDPRGNPSTYSYDGAGRVTSATDALNHTRATTYSPNDDILTAVDGEPAANTVRYTYTGAAGGYRPTSVTLPTGASATAQYGSSRQYQPSSTINTQGNTTTLSYDSAGNVTSGITGGVTTLITYNPPAGQATVCAGGGKPGQPCTSTDGRGNITTFTYDSIGNLTRVAPPSGAIKATSYTYDSAGQITTMTDGKGQVTAYTYDGANRTTQVRYGGATSCATAANCQVYTYDGDGNLTKRVDAGGTTTYTYDQRGALSGQVTTASSGGGSKSSALTYDATGNVSSFTEAGATTTYGYDAGNNLVSLAEPGGSCSGTVSLCTRYEYNANDVRTKVTYPGGTTVNYLQIDASSRPLQYRATNPGGAVLMDFTYSFSANGVDSGLVQTRSDATIAGNAVQTYRYDGRDRLVQATERLGATTSAQWTYCFDANGNRTYDSTSTVASVLCPASSGGPAATYSYDATNALTSRAGSPGYTYDNNGYELAGGGSTARTAATWNTRGQLTALTANGVAHTYAYAGESNKERVSFDGAGYQNTALGITTQSGTGAHTVIREPNGTPVAIRMSGASYYFIADRQGSTIALVDASGAKRNSYSYDPYGASRAKNEQVTNPYQYLGSQLDAATGLYHLQARYYDPSIGRFTSPDPSGQESNTYIYSEANPCNKADPSGLSTAYCLFTIATTVASYVFVVGRLYKVARAAGVSLREMFRLIANDQFDKVDDVYEILGEGAKNATGINDIVNACS